MKLSDYLRMTHIVPDLTADSKAQVMRSLSSFVSDQIPDLTSDALYEGLMDREKLGSTGIGSGIAIPHAKFGELTEDLVFLAASRDGVPFDSIDGKPVHLVFLVLGGRGRSELHLKVLARISRILHDTGFRDQLCSAETTGEMYEIIRKKDEQY